jgi:hypothetical protein
VCVNLALWDTAGGAGGGIPGGGGALSSGGRSQLPALRAVKDAHTMVSLTYQQLERQDISVGDKKDKKDKRSSLHFEAPTAGKEGT